MNNSEKALIAVALLILSFVGIQSWRWEKPHHIPTPAYPEESQPICGLATLSMLSAEVLNRDIAPDQWNIKSTDDYVNVQDVIDAWSKISHRVPKKTEVITFDDPHIWVGRFQGYNHMCLCYYQSNHVTLKHGVYDPETKTNYITVWDYPTYFKNTLEVYTP
jgi:hypothetical protein